MFSDIQEEPLQLHQPIYNQGLLQELTSTRRWKTKPGADRSLSTDVDRKNKDMDQDLLLDHHHPLLLTLKNHRAQKAPSR